MEFEPLAPEDLSEPAPAGLGERAKTRFLHYVNLPRVHGRLQALLRDFRWGRMDDIFLGTPPGPIPTAAQIAV